MDRRPPIAAETGSFHLVARGCIALALLSWGGFAAAQAPVANDDAYITDEDKRLSVRRNDGLFANDSDDHKKLDVILVSGTSNGTLNVNLQDGSFQYTPDTNFNGDDTFTYQASDGNLQSNVATVTITVVPTPDSPNAIDDVATVAEDSVENLIDVLDNDSDPDGDAIMVTAVSAPANGSATIAGGGAGAIYAPNPDFSGNDSFTYTIEDATGRSDTATVSVAVTGLDDPPVANPDGYDTAEDSVLIVDAAAGVLANDTDSDGDALTAALDSNVGRGTLVFNADGSFEYMPDQDFNGGDSFTYVANDGNGDSAPATVLITVDAVNDAPVASDDSYEIEEDTTLAIAAEVDGLLANDTDVDGDELTALIFTSPEHGMVAINANGTFTYDPDANYAGSDLFVYRVTDGQADIAGPVTATVLIDIGSVNDPPEGPDEPIDAGVATESVPYEFDLAPFFSDGDNDELYFRANEGEHPTGLPLSGNLRVDEDGSLTGVRGRMFGTIDASDTSDAGPRTITLTVADRPFDDPLRAEATATAFLTLAARDRIDISLAGVVAPAPALVDETVEWTLTITNSSPLEGVSQIALDVIFGGVPTLISSAAGCTIAAPSVSCAIGPAPPGGALVQTITTRPGAAGDSTLQATAMIADGPGLEPLDPDLSNNDLFLTLNVSKEFSDGPSQTVGSSSRGGAAGDINGDGYPDLVLARGGGQSTELYISASDDPSNPDREPYRVIGATPIQLGDSDVASQGALLADIDNDGDLDLIVANGGPRSGAPNSVYLNESVNGLARLTATAAPLGDQATWDLAAADLNLDGFVDIIAANGSPNEIFLNRGGGRFDAAPSLGNADSHAVAVADFDGDGWPDLVFANYDRPNTLYLGLGNGSFAEAIEIEQEPATSLLVGDFAGNDLPDIIFSHSASSKTSFKSIHINASVPGAPSFSSQIASSLGSSPTIELAMLDTDLDGDDDIVSLNSTGTHQIFLAQGGGVFVRHPVQFSSATPMGSAIDDFNGDGRADLAIAGPSGTQIFLNDGHGNLGPGDVTPPVLRLLGENSVTVTVGSGYTDAGAVATDDADGAITDAIVVGNAPNTSVIGTYVVTFSVTDSSGNDSAPVTRTVTVQANQPSGGGGGGSFGIDILALAGFACLLWRWRRPSAGSAIECGASMSDLRRQAASRDPLLVNGSRRFTPRIRA